MSEEQSSSTPVAQDQTSLQTEEKQIDQTTSQGAAARLLLAQLINEDELTTLHAHQATTLKRLVHVRNGLAAINKHMANEYSTVGTEFGRTTRLASQVQSDLQDITTRLDSLKKKLSALRSSSTPSTTRSDQDPQSTAQTSSQS